ncbi:hypothetical protein [Haloferula sp.]|uniref:hypothetical protein n=1 Tax=Haloferula sp. TaxID=2497595 RepID=UPI003C71D3A7
MKFSHPIKSLVQALTLVVAVPSCTNTAFIGHDRAYDANLTMAADLTSVLSLNAGYEGRSYVAVPPENALHWKKLVNPSDVAEGEALSTLSAVKVQRVAVDDKLSVGDKAIAVDSVACSATGDAADAVGKSIETAPETATNPPEDTAAAEAGSIATDPASINTGETVYN